MKKYILMALIVNVLYFFWIFTFGRHQLPFLIMLTSMISVAVLILICNFLDGIRFVACAILGSYIGSLIAMAITRMVKYPFDQWGYSILSPHNLMFPIYSMGLIYSFICILLWHRYKKLRQ